MNLQHIAFIADGNRRWAKRHLLPRALGHKRGFDKMISVADHCADLGIPFVSFFAFSTENWNREKEEIDEIFRLIRENLSKQTKHFIKKEIRVLFLGDLTRFDEDFRQAAKECMEKTKDLQRMTLILCVNYGGRADIIQAVQKGGADFEKYIYTNAHNIPDPDLVVRTSGEQRISNFMLWQMAYSELKFIDTLWPDITDEIIDGIVAEFVKRDRRRGK
jgi:undecaprenyl diphosphate synthase